MRFLRCAVTSLSCLVGSLGVNDWENPNTPVELYLGATYNLRWNNPSPGNITLELRYNFMDHGGDINDNDTVQNIVEQGPNNGSCTFVPSLTLEVGRYWLELTGFEGQPSDSPYLNLESSAGSTSTSDEASSSAVIGVTSPSTATSTTQPAGVVSSSVGGAQAPSTESSSSSTTATAHSSPSTVLVSVITVFSVSTPGFTTSALMTRTTLDSKSSVVTITTQAHVVTATGAPVTRTVTESMSMSMPDMSSATTPSSSETGTALSRNAKIGIGAGAGAFGLAVIAICLWLALRHQIKSRAMSRGRARPSNQPLPERMEESVFGADGQTWEHDPSYQQQHSFASQQGQSMGGIATHATFPSSSSSPQHGTETPRNRSWAPGLGNQQHRNSSANLGNSREEIGTDRSLPSELSSLQLRSELGADNSKHDSTAQQSLGTAKQRYDEGRVDTRGSLPSELASPQLASEAGLIACSELVSPQAGITRDDEVRFELVG